MNPVMNVLELEIVRVIFQGIVLAQDVGALVDASLAPRVLYALRESVQEAGHCIGLPARGVVFLEFVMVEFEVTLRERRVVAI